MEQKMFATSVNRLPDAVDVQAGQGSAENQQKLQNFRIS